MKIKGRVSSGELEPFVDIVQNNSYEVPIKTPVVWSVIERGRNGTLV